MFSLGYLEIPSGFFTCFSLLTLSNSVFSLSVSVSPTAKIKIKESLAEGIWTLF